MPVNYFNVNTKRYSYLCHMIDKNGLHPLKNKMEVVVNAPAPTNATELK